MAWHLKMKRYSASYLAIFVYLEWVNLAVVQEPGTSVNILTVPTVIYFSLCKSFWIKALLNALNVNVVLAQNLYSRYITFLNTAHETFLYRRSICPSDSCNKRVTPVFKTYLCGPVMCGSRETLYLKTLLSLRTPLLGKKQIKV